MFETLNRREPQRRRYLETFGPPAEGGPVAPHYSCRAASFLFWGQHCTECAAPACYKTCSLYDKNLEHRCETFVYGLAPTDRYRTLHPFAVECPFKPHAVLFTHLTLPQFPLRRLRRIERAYEKLLGPTAQALDWPFRVIGRKPFFQRALHYGLVKYLYRMERRIPEPPPDGFLVHVVNPNAQPIDFSVHIMSEPRRPEDRAFQDTARLAPGFNEILIPFERLSAAVDFTRSARISLFCPGGRPQLLIVLAADMVTLEGSHLPERPGGKPVKCVVFDLDRTLWDGILVEDHDAVRLKPNVLWLLEQLDRRGILLSIASKNNPDEAMARLKAFGIDAYFLHPQVSWEPKSRGIESIARTLNIGIDTLAFLDDSPFEREEVRQACPAVWVLSEKEMPLLLRHPLLKGSDSPESRQRRHLYFAESKRQEFHEASGLDYDDFLRQCRMTLRIHRPGAEHVERLHELIQRTNQLNFSGNRYSRQDLERLLADPARELFVMQSADRFGEYGLVGAGVLATDGAAPRLIDLALSCRVQSRRVEHAFLLWLMERLRRRGAESLEVIYNKTARNEAAGKVFDDLEFIALSDDQGRRLLRKSLREEPAPQDILQVVDEIEPSARGREPEAGPAPPSATEPAPA